MSNKREIKRHKKRLSIHFGIEEATRVAFTEDISAIGMFIKTPNVCPPNTKIKVIFNLGENNMVELEARVMWSKKVPQNLFHLVKKSGMGIRFLRFYTGQERYLQFCESISIDK